MKTSETPVTAAPSLKSAVKALEASKQAYVTKSPNVKSVSFNTKETTKNVLAAARSGEIVQAYATLCPIYDKSTGGIRGDYASFEDVPARFRAKYEGTVSAVKFLSSVVPVRVTYLLADRGMLVGPEYDSERSKSDLAGIYSLYAAQLGVDDPAARLATFSNIGIDLPELCDSNEPFSESDVRELLDRRGCEMSADALQIVIKAFGTAGAYYFIQNYLDESAQLARNFKGDVFVNSEFCSPLNSLYRKGDRRAMDANCMMLVNLNSAPEISAIKK